MAMVDNPISPYTERVNRLIAEAKDPASLTDLLFREYQFYHDADKPSFVAALISHISSEEALKRFHARRADR